MNVGMRKRLGSVAAMAALACAVLSAAADQGAGDRDLLARIAALEAGQRAILTELQELKVLLQSRPPALPATPPAQPPPNPSAAAAPVNLDLDIAGAPAKGAPDARLVLIEFSDFQCPFCGRYTRDTLPQLERDYVETGKLLYVFRHFPLERLHPLALRAAEAGVCAQQQGKFWPMHTRLFANQQELGEADLTRSAAAVGVSMTPFQQCMAGQAASPARVRQDQTEGARAGITGTPAFFIGTMTKAGKVHVLKKMIGAQPYASFKATLDGLLASADPGR